MKRKFYDKLLNWKNNNITTPLMVVGARQVGKTYIINEFCKKEFDDYIYINLLDDKEIIEYFKMDISTSEKIEKMKLYLNRQIFNNTIIFIDEIQESEELISALKYFCENEFPYKIICAGSLLGVKINRFSSSFPVGKVRILKMYQMDFEEYLMAIKADMLIPVIKECFVGNKKMDDIMHKRLLKYYFLYLCVGGMPEAVQTFVDSDLDILNFDDNTIESIIISYVADMNKYVNNVFESAKIEKIYNNLPSQLLKENKKFMFGKVEKNARKRDYESSIEWLISSNLVIPSYLVSKCSTPLKGYIVTDYFKLYINDTGILSKMLNLPYNKIVLNEKMEFLGAITENYVANQLTMNGFDLYYFSKNQVAEVDFLIDTNDGVVPIEVKSSDNVLSKGLKYYIDKNNPKYSIRISSKNFGFENNIKSVPLYAVFCIK